MFSLQNVCLYHIPAIWFNVGGILCICWMIEDIIQGKKKDNIFNHLKMYY